MITSNHRLDVCRVTDGAHVEITRPKLKRYNVICKSQSVLLIHLISFNK